MPKRDDERQAQPALHQSGIAPDRQTGGASPIPSGPDPLVPESAITPFAPTSIPSASTGRDLTPGRRARPPGPAGSIEEAVTDRARKIHEQRMRAPKSPFQVRAERALRGEPGFVDLFSEGFALDSTIMAAVRMLDAGGLPLDPNFVLTPEIQRFYLEDIPEDLHDDVLAEFLGATSFKHLNMIRNQILTDLDRERRIGRHGGAGLLARIAANVADPVNLVLALGTGGMSFLNTGSRLARMAKLGTLTSAESAAIEAFVARQSATRDSSDVAFAALGGFILGGAAGSIGRSSQMRDAVNDAMDRLDRQAAGEALDAGGQDAAGAARARDVTEPLLEAEVARRFDVSTDPDVPRSAKGRARFDAVGRLGQSDDPFVRDLGRSLAQEAVGLEGHGVVRFGASEFAALLYKRIMAPFQIARSSGYRDWLAENNISTLGAHNPVNIRAFNREVGRAVVRAGDHPSPAVNRAVEQARVVAARLLEEAKRVGVEGFDEIQPNPRYLPRSFDLARVRELTARFGESEIVRLIKVGMRRAAPDLSDETAQRVARAYFMKVRRMASGMDLGLAHGIRTDDLDFLREMLRDAGLDDEAIETTIQQTRRAVEKSSRVKHAKRRLDLDEGATIQARDVETGEMTTLSVDDLFDRDIDLVLSEFSRRMTGAIGLARQAGIRSPADARKVIDVIRSRGDELGRKQSAIDADVKRVKFLIEGIQGYPLETDPTSLFARSARAARDINFARIGASFGIAQLPEIGAILATAGLRNVMAHVPAMRGMIRRGVGGKLEDKLAAELEDMVAPGVDRLLNTPLNRWEEHGARGVLGRADDALQMAKRATADIGGLNATTIVFQRMAARGIAQKLLGFAHGARLSRGQQRRFRAMGISDEMWGRIKAQMRKHSTTTRSRFVPGGRKLREINPAAWDDPEALDTLMLALNREARRVVQEVDIGNTPIWIHDTIGKFMVQFRMFSIVAWSKATLHNIHHWDFQAFMNTALSTTIGGMAYVAQQSLNIRDKSEREKRLQPAEIAKAAFQRAGIFSLIPMLIDTALPLLASDPMFRYGRASGLATGFVSGAPVVDLVNDLYSAAGMPAVTIHPGKQVTQRDFRNAMGLLPVLGGMVGIKRVIDALGEDVLDLPERRDAR